MTTTPLYPSSVRQPSHLCPPYNARQWAATQAGLSLVFVGVPPRYAPVTWGSCDQLTMGSTSPTIPQTGPGFPTGMRGVLSFHFFQAFDLLQSLTPQGNLQWSFVKNGAVVPGYCQRNFEYRNMVEQSLTNSQFELTLRSMPVQAPIHLQEDDKLDFLVEGAVASSWVVNFEFGGWMYTPTVEGEAGTIRETAQDPGVRQPLANPFPRAPAGRRRRR